MELVYALIITCQQFPIFKSSNFYSLACGNSKSKKKSPLVSDFYLFLMRIYVITDNPLGLDTSKILC
jgi:hypothetical protein